ncbi:bifunctional 4-hydroxy-2-oxoglutarate aldolase/2-dehydro-3-deoxy-phosphogluconate aldolase [Marinovum sp. 2_MG-2023]|uniref:bifunctional 4-hydroxy-2-oxoglutarate aldolase/2-dehydro-3-deoxy-phosphogluconate aldolase n=1 Tax=unclassified Marinovum TaxID=2647166 RepID=UPI0026E1BB9A|nr:MULTISPECIES: bifunctional 4-hydroxy-2-oxoglutarate aldolase/2-dehydro-3-deoxy-phosphogluconate aldolase [unclassified Marinovum]MDO6732756.1 bifunctional 4-hydroxy-2-oxoglutarate aldolase/2-dehydro-3-deoxy-phosphogluconate aldolase [Marinovum sp. 2_MG-2023]MDO6782030.1 bifunctional 4-hydroxy-2-oxoglutarate aldolase/2-dehydro-3-deoxy-phosphogluconate aldolase [Marinovum sp. 1_MG-2023]
MTDTALEKIAQARLLPVVVLERAEDAVPLAKALLAGGLAVAEVTFRSDAAAESLSAIAAEVPDMLIGAGTVLTEAQVQAALDAGAQFLVTPGYNPKVVAAARAAGLPIVPGVNNPTGVEAAMADGLDAVKFFPAEQTGGVAFLKALSGPYRQMRFIPTGGIGLGNLGNYLSLPSVLACGGSWMVDPKLIAAGKFDEISKLTAAAVEAARAA